MIILSNRICQTADRLCVSLSQQIVTTLILQLERAMLQAVIYGFGGVELTR
jgi:hypothetical protein